MTPILRRLAGLLGRTAERSAPRPDTSAAPAPAGGRRRGGRGRGRGGGGSAPAPTDSRAGGRGQASDGARRDARQDSRSTSNGSGANGSSGYGNSSYDRRRPRRRDLDQPLPEDIAFRPPAEGGDRSILPSRRRPPPGLRATKRVLLAGRRFVPRGVGGAEDPDEAVGGLPEVVSLPDVSNALPGTPSEPRAGEEGEPAKRRRRGRRGGRGRKRSGDASAPSSDGA